MGLEDLHTELSLLRRANELLRQENENLRLGRDSLLERLRQLEVITTPCQNCLAMSDSWLLQASGVNYSRLKELLAQKDWEAADLETQRLLLKIAGQKAEERGFLDATDIDRLPCIDLKIINKLWSVYSNGKYGYIVQQQIWSQTRSTANLWGHPDFDGYYPMREGIGYSLAQRILRCALESF
ncbi:MAG: GUN4 domain-containing protein [Gloeomargarita sp. SKYBB_i_bin120]|nr:GUN4 domain-containing protein [Gloeomargarita sp. SKYG98]MCS7291464.1 GUN4 domain-containing protein [Gloeomargarita sp. SKYB120]MDW8177024.1 GUN4 domain-containing protein [Gloeomargarita sp. SKYBB_i_bin120]